MLVMREETSPPAGAAKLPKVQVAEYTSLKILSDTLKLSVCSSGWPLLLGVVDAGFEVLLDTAVTPFKRRAVHARIKEEEVVMCIFRDWMSYLCFPDVDVENKEY